MYVFEMNVDSPLEYLITGKFEAPSPNWMHERFPLNEYELIIMTRGTLYITYVNNDYTVKAGEMLILPPSPPPDNIRKGFRPSDCSFYWLHFVDKAPVKLVDAPYDTKRGCPYPVSGNRVVLPRKAMVPNMEKAIVLLKQLQDAVRTRYCPMTINYMTTTVLCELHSQFYAQAELAKQDKRSQRQTYHDIVDYVKQNTAICLKVSDVAEHFGYNEKYLSHLFSSISGIPLKQFILKNKMDTANYLLTDTNSPINDIATSLGFNDSHNFAKAYKKIAGLTPSEYRNAFSKRLLFHV